MTPAARTYLRIRRSHRDRCRSIRSHNTLTARAYLDAMRTRVAAVDCERRRARARP